MSRRDGRGVALLAAAVFLVSVTGCSASGSNANGTDPIVVASVNALSGPVVVKDSSLAAKAVFDEFNARGGLGGRRIDYVVLDDKSDPSAAASAARDAVDNRGAVALVGGASTTDVQVNSAYYGQAGIVSIPGIGTDQLSFASPNISPVNTGPFVGAELTLDYATKSLGLTRICGLVGVGGTTQSVFEETFARWTKKTGRKFAWLDFIPYSSPDFTPYLIRAKQAGCDGFFFNGQTSLALAVMNAAQAQGMKDLTFLFFTSAYSQEFADAAPAIGKGVYIVSEFAPYTDLDKGSATADWAALMRNYGVPLTSFAQGGYLAATNFLRVLGGVRGEITRDSVTAAFKAQSTGIENTMVGTPWIFGPGNTHSSNQAGWPIVLTPGSKSWKRSSDTWATLSNYR
jgi:branched-chain amino acid transport system substrate-binding protein